MRKFIIVLSIILLALSATIGLVSCSDEPGVPVRDPLKTGNPDVLFYDEFEMDSSSYYDPRNINEAMKYNSDNFKIDTAKGLVYCYNSGEQEIRFNDNTFDDGKLPLITPIELDKYSYDLELSFVLGDLDIDNVQSTFGFNFGSDKYIKNTSNDYENRIYEACWIYKKDGFLCLGSRQSAKEDYKVKSGDKITIKTTFEKIKQEKGVSENTERQVDIKIVAQINDEEWVKINETTLGAIKTDALQDSLRIAFYGAYPKESDIKEPYAILDYVKLSRSAIN